MTGVESREQYNKSDSSRISKVEPRNLISSLYYSRSFLFFGGDYLNLFIGSSSKDNVDFGYLKDGAALIGELAKIEGVDLVFGAHHKGLMKLSYDEFKRNNKKIIGVITNYHKEMVDSSIFYDKEIIVNTTTERFEKIYENSDVLLFLPGGLGTYAEIFSAIEERRIDNGKKIIIYNSNYFYTPMIKELYKLYKEGFIDEVPADYMIIESDSNKIIEIIKKEID